MTKCPYCNIALDDSQVKNRKCNSCLHEWEIYHIMPNNDLKIHDQSHLCSCNPRVRNHEENMFVIHDAFDGRLGVEWANEILNNK